jgi:serine/threonine-protein kinase
MAPEQLRGVPASPASDQYALAAVAYEMLSGWPPYAATTPVGLAEAQAEPPAAIAGARPQLDAAVRRALAGDPAERYPDVTAFAAAVATSVQAARAADETEVVAVVAAPSVVAGPSVVDASPATPAPGAAARFRRPRRAVAVAAAIGVAVLAGTIVLGSLAGGGVPSPDAQADLATPIATPTVTPTPPPATDDGAKPDKGGKPDNPGKPDKDDAGRGGGNGNPGRGND